LRRTLRLKEQYSAINTTRHKEEFVYPNFFVGLCVALLYNDCTVINSMQLSINNLLLFHIAEARVSYRPIHVLHTKENEDCVNFPWQ
jgi:hypothetical protein